MGAQVGDARKQQDVVDSLLHDTILGVAGESVQFQRHTLRMDTSNGQREAVSVQFLPCKRRKYWRKRLLSERVRLRLWRTRHAAARPEYP
jgi:hypothetical protein